VTQIDVAANPRDPTTFVVTLRDDDGSSTTHDVRIDPASASLAARYPSEATFVDACFRFLLEREPKESILRSFDVREIGRYFPGWEDEIPAG